MIPTTFNQVTQFHLELYLHIVWLLDRLKTTQGVINVDTFVTASQFSPSHFLFDGKAGKSYKTDGPRTPADQLNNMEL